MRIHRELRLKRSREALISHLGAQLRDGKLGCSAAVSKRAVCFRKRVKKLSPETEHQENEI